MNSIKFKDKISKDELKNLKESGNINKIHLYLDLSTLQTRFPSTASAIISYLKSIRRGNIKKKLIIHILYNDDSSKLNNKFNRKVIKHQLRYRFSASDYSFLEVYDYLIMTEKIKPDEYPFRKSL